MRRAKGKVWKEAKVGHATVKIYKVDHANSKTGKTHVLAWHTSEGRKTRKIANESKAVGEARLKAAQLNSGQIEAADMTQGDRTELVEIRAICGETPPLSAIKEWAAARKLVGSDILTACTKWAERQGTRRTAVSVSDTVTRFIKSKRADNIKVESSYLRTLPAFVKAFGEQSVSTITPDQLAEYLQTYENANSRISHHKRITAFFNWCRDREILPLDIKTVSERVRRPRYKNTEIGTITPDELRRAFQLIESKAPEYIPALTISAMCGLRRSEVHAQQWEHIDLKRSLLRVSGAKPNTPARRLVSIPPAGVERLAKYQQDVGPVCTNLSVDRFRDICRTAGLDLAKNGTRHTWISARVTITGNIPEVAIEAGNSVEVIHRHYRELLRKDEAQAWFSV